MCLTFIGQAMASTFMSYKMLGMSSMSMSVMSEQAHFQNMAMMDHSNHNMASSDTEDSSTEDCCAQVCHCFTGGCSNVATFMNDVNNTTIIDNSSKIHSVVLLAKSQQPTSLYRPPIFS